MTIYDRTIKIYIIPFPITSKSPLKIALWCSHIHIQKSNSDVLRSYIEVSIIIWPIWVTVSGSQLCPSQNTKKNMLLARSCLLVTVRSNRWGKLSARHLLERTVTGLTYPNLFPWWEIPVTSLIFLCTPMRMHARTVYMKKWSISSCR
jgi:hypothetical protein